MTELTRHGRFWQLGNLRLCDVRELEEISYENSRLRRENELLNSRLERQRRAQRPDTDPVVRKNRELLREKRDLQTELAELKQKRMDERYRPVAGAALDDAGLR
ncbi:MAG: hypothetical protein OXF66_02115 [Gammaproteobacteria bacterium]|nr:hypothetical protein [Gammaproteobacteria bacterium]